MSIYTQVLNNNGSVENFKRILKQENPLHEELAMVSLPTATVCALLHMHGGIGVLTESVIAAINSTCDVFDEPYYVDSNIQAGVTIDMVYALDMLCLRGYEHIIVKELIEDVRISAAVSNCRHCVKQQFFL